MVNLELFRVFYTVAKCGSITKAADELFISQPAVSQAIKQLESQLGGKLFNRVSRGMELTENGGKQVFEYVEKAISLLEKAEGKFSELNETAVGSLRISAPDTIITHILMNYIIKFHEEFPNVSVSFLNSTSRETIEAVKSGKADIGFINLPIEESGVTFTGQMCKLNDVFVASEQFSELKGKKIPLSSLSNYPLLMLEQNTATRQEFISFTNTLGVDLTPEFELSSLELCVEMAKSGLGITCVSREFVKEELKSGKLFELDVQPALPVRAIGVILPKDKELNYGLSSFLKLLNENSELGF
jgi:DNA-binding transcriptional LysR family regulator